MPEYDNSNANGSILAYVSGLAVFALPMGKSFHKKLFRGWMALRVTLLVATAMSRAAVMAVLLGTAVYVAGHPLSALANDTSRHWLCYYRFRRGFFALQTIFASDLYEPGIQRVVP